MVCGAFSFHGKSNLRTIITFQDSAEYQSHLQSKYSNNELVTVLPGLKPNIKHSGMLLNKVYDLGKQYKSIAELNAAVFWPEMSWI